MCASTDFSVHVFVLGGQRKIGCRPLCNSHGKHKTCDVFFKLFFN